MKLVGKLALAVGAFVLGGVATYAAKKELKEAVPEIWDGVTTFAGGLIDKFSEAKGACGEAQEIFDDMTDA